MLTVLERRDLSGNVITETGATVWTSLDTTTKSNANWRYITNGVEIDLPGVKRETINLVFLEKSLTLKYEIRGQHLCGTFDIPWGKNVDENNVGATFVDGVLTVILPCIPEKLGKKIEIK